VDFYYCHVARLHDYVRSNVFHDTTLNNQIKPPDVAVKTGKAGTKSHAVLLASLLEAIGAEVQIIKCVSSQNVGHFLPEVYLADSSGYETQDIADSLSDYYESSGYDYDPFCYDAVDSRIWYPADSILGKYVGDIAPHLNQGYVRGSHSSWSWNKVDYIYSTSEGVMTYKNTPEDLDQLLNETSNEKDLERRLDRLTNQNVQMEGNCPQCNQRVTRDVSRSIASSLISSAALEVFCPGCGTVEILIGDWDLFSPF
jgi:hypothetical protein